MDTLQDKKLKKIPQSFQQELSNLFENDEKIEMLEKILQNTGIIFEKDRFQIPLHSVEDLYNMKRYFSEIKKINEKEIKKQADTLN